MPSILNAAFFISNHNEETYRRKSITLKGLICERNLVQAWGWTVWGWPRCFGVGVGCSAVFWLFSSASVGISGVFSNNWIALLRDGCMHGRSQSIIKGKQSLAKTQPTQLNSSWTPREDCCKKLNQETASRTREHRAYGLRTGLVWTKAHVKVLSSLLDPRKQPDSQCLWTKRFRTKSHKTGGHHPWDNTINEGSLRR